MTSSKWLSGSRGPSSVEAVSALASTPRGALLGPVAALALTLWMAATAAPTLGQESIFDPENPRLGSPPEGGEEAEQDTVESGDEGPTEVDETGGSDSPQLIVDPENPLAPAPGPEEAQGTGQIIADPERPDLTIQAGAGGPSTGFTRSWFRGDYRGRFYFDTLQSQGEDIFLLFNRLELRAKIEFDENWTAIIQGRLEHRLWGQENPDGANLFVNSEHIQADFEPSLREAFVSGHLGDVFIRVGNQKIAWSAGTLTRPADVINPVDYRDGQFDAPAEQRIPVLAAVATLIVDRVSLSAVLVPFFEPNQVDLVGTDWSAVGPASPLVLVRTLYGAIAELYDESQEARIGAAGLPIGEYPEPVPENASAGARVTSTYGGVDLGLGYFFGWDRTLFVEVERDVATLLERINQTRRIDLPVDAHYERLHTVEFDLATYLGDIGVRFETAFNPDRTIYTRGLLPRRYPLLMSALGLSYEESESLAIQVEGVWAHFFDVPEGEELLLIEPDYWGVGGLALLGLDRFDALERTFLADLSLRLFGFVGISTGEWLLYPSAAYGFGDNVEVGLGAMIFEGPKPTSREATLGGWYDGNDQMYLSVDVAF